jgi:amphi-Trp domain-containing protein
MRRRDLTRTYSRAQFAAKLRRLADAIEAATPFTLQVAGERLHVPADVTFNVEHERSGPREELEFQLLWERAGTPPSRSPGGRPPRRQAETRGATRR